MMLSYLSDKLSYPCKYSEAPDGSGADVVLTEAHLMTLEDAIRDAVRVKRSVHEGSKDSLMKMFKCVEGGAMQGSEGVHVRALTWSSIFDVTYPSSLPCNPPFKPTGRLMTAVVM